MMMMMKSTVGSISDLSNFINAKIFGHFIANERKFFFDGFIDLSFLHLLVLVLEVLLEL